MLSLLFPASELFLIVQFLFSFAAALALVGCGSAMLWADLPAGEYVSESEKERIQDDVRIIIVGISIFTIGFPALILGFVYLIYKVAALTIKGIKITLR